ncbi:MAG: DUF1444 family protein, partial [Pirellulaceae bacterium]
MTFFDYIFGSSARDQFARQVLLRMQAAGEVRTVSYRRESFELIFQGEDEAIGVACLNNLFREFEKLAPARREAFLSQATKALLSHYKQIPDDLADARPDILPIVRNRSYFELRNLEQRVRGGPSLGLPYIEIGEHLMAAPVYDLPESIRTIEQARLDTWGISLYEVMELAVRNLDDIEIVIQSMDDQVFLIASGDNYDASRLLLMDRLRDLPLKGDPVAMLPHRDFLVITGEQNPLGLQIMLDLIEQQLSTPRPICWTPAVLRGDQWQTWLPPGGHPLHRRYRELHLREMADVYHDQREIFGSAQSPQGRDLFLATFHVEVSEDSGTAYSYCVWPRSEYSLLPRTDYVVIMDEEVEMPLASAAWEDVERIAGNLWEDA